MISTEVADMTDYQKMYYTLFNAITDALELAGQGRLAAALDLLRRAQSKAEEMYIEATEQKS